MATKQLKDGRWICYYRSLAESGLSKQIREYFGRGPEGRAAAVNRDSEIEKALPHRKDPGATLAELAKIYVAEKDFTAYPKKHLLIRLSANILPALGDKPALRLDHRTLDGYVKKRLAAGVKRSTVRREIADIKAILNFAVKRNPPLIPFNPIQAFSPPKSDDAVIIPPNASEVRRIIDAAGSKATHLVRFIYLTWYIGARPGPVEVFSLTWRDVRFDEKVFQIVSAKKGGSPFRDVPIHPKLMSHLKTWHKKDGGGDGFILHQKGRRIKTLLKSWTRAVRDAEIHRRLRPYDLRHHFATRALEASGDIKTFSEIMGFPARHHHGALSARQPFTAHQNRFADPVSGPAEPPRSRG